MSTNGYDSHAMTAREGEPCECCGIYEDLHWHHAIVRRMRRKPALNAMFQPAAPLHSLPPHVPLKRLRGTSHSLADELWAIR